MAKTDGDGQAVHDDCYLKDFRFSFAQSKETACNAAIAHSTQSVAMASDDHRVQKILQDMQNLHAESKALAKKHKRVMKDYERLKRELEALHKSRRAGIDQQ